MRRALLMSSSGSKYKNLETIARFIVQVFCILVGLFWLYAAFNAGIAATCDTMEGPDPVRVGECHDTVITIIKWKMERLWIL